MNATTRSKTVLVPAGRLMTPRDLKAKIFSRLALDTALPHLNPVVHARYTALDCPECGASGRAFAYHGSETAICNRRNECGAESSLVALLTGRGVQPLVGDQLLQALRELAQSVGLDPAMLGEHDVQAMRDASERDRVLRGVQYEARRGLHDEARGLEYLQSRGFNEGHANDLDLGYLTAHALKRVVDRYGDSLARLGVNSGFVGHITALGRDRHGTVVALHGRYAGDAEADAVRAKMMTKGGQSKATPFLLDEAARSGNEVLLVEGVFDALACHAHGERRACAVLGNTLTETQSLALKEAGIVHAFLCLDSDNAGSDGTLRSINQLAERGITTSVVPPFAVLDQEAL